MLPFILCVPCRIKKTGVQSQQAGLISGWTLLGRGPGEEFFCVCACVLSAPFDHLCGK